MKLYKERNNIGSAKYVVSFHDGIKLHTDGSKFYDIRIFKNKIKKNTFIKELVKDGYTAL